MQWGMMRRTTGLSRSSCRFHSAVNTKHVRPKPGSAAESAMFSCALQPRRTASFFITTSEPVQAQTTPSAINFLSSVCCKQAHRIIFLLRKAALSHGVSTWGCDCNCIITIIERWDLFSYLWTPKTAKPASLEFFCSEQIIHDWKGW